MIGKLRKYSKRLNITIANCCSKYWLDSCFSVFTALLLHPAEELRFQDQKKKGHSHFNLTVSQVEDTKICPAEHINELKENNQEYKQWVRMSDLITKPLLFFRGCTSEDRYKMWPQRELYKVIALKMIIFGL